MRVRKRPELETTEVEQTLQRLRPRIELWPNRSPRPMRLVRIHELLVRDGYLFSYSALLRFAHRELGWRERPATVLIDDAPLGEEAQIDFGLMGELVDEQGKRRKLWALIVTLAASRYQFVWPTFQQTTCEVIDRLEAAWRFFGGVPKRVVLDNMTSAVTQLGVLSPMINRTFLEYSQSRSFFVDPARVRRPQDKGRVENQVPYVRERCFDGENFPDLWAAREHAERWCRDVAGMREHGTTHKMPREEYEQLEKAAMQLAPVTPWTKMRKGYGLLRLCEKYGASTVNALCEHSLAFDVVDVPRMESMLKAGWTPGGEQTVEGKRSEPCNESRRTELGGRFARDPASFATQAKEEKP